jgi:2-C-methyl-D-erythritol 4-phosphate cytidylyltransferase
VKYIQRKEGRNKEKRIAHDKGTESRQQSKNSITAKLRKKNDSESMLIYV